MRRFYLINDIGEEYPLNSHKTGFLQNVSGLGWTQTTSYIKTGNAWRKSYGEDDQTPLNGEVLFSSVGSSPYQKYMAFTKWVRTSKNIVVCYETDAGKYYKDVDIVAIEKKEITEGKVLVCPIKMNGKSLWYQNESERFAVNFSDSTSRFPLNFPVTFHDYSSGDIVVDNDGSVDAAIAVTFTGAISKPKIELVHGDEVKTFVVDYEAGTSESIKYSSRDNDPYIVHVDAQGVETNLYNHLNIDNENFFKVPIGTSTIKLSADSDIVNPIYLNIYKEYRTV